jgi:hypothetical protein
MDVNTCLPGNPDNRTSWYQNLLYLLRNQSGIGRLDSRQRIIES